VGTQGREGALIISGQSWISGSLLGLSLLSGRSRSIWVIPSPCDTSWVTLLLLGDSWKSWFPLRSPFMLPQQEGRKDMFLFFFYEWLVHWEQLRLTTQSEYLGGWRTCYCPVTKWNFLSYTWRLWQSLGMMIGPPLYIYSLDMEIQASPFIMGWMELKLFHVAGIEPLLSKVLYLARLCLPWSF
jgi:hypothetical protein